ncbi:MAG TPA: hypothetical protein VMT87_16865, partial [Vicinamibacteria bacterium]|nr:hypothetical protein [Vicinamibacteria bacterium]
MIGLLLAAFLAAAPPAAPQTASEATDLINTLLAGLGGFRDLTGRELQDEVAEAGGVPFRSDVPLDFLSRSALAAYVQDVLDTEYPPGRADADERTLVALDLLPPRSDLRRLRARLLEENVAGFYDERPGRKRLYAVSDDRTFTPANQLVLAHELRHALQDQYADVHGTLTASIGDFDDRRMAYLSLLEGDATLVMERFLLRRLPGAPEALGDLGGFSLPPITMPGVPTVLQDQLVLPYLAGRDFARALWRRGGWDAVRAAWSRPPASTEQVLHPEKYFAGEAPRPPAPAYAPPGGRLVSESVLGEMFTRTLLGEGSDAAAAGWGGDLVRVYDVSGRTLLVWTSGWDTPADAGEFAGAARARFRARHGAPSPAGGFDVFTSG